MEKWLSLGLGKEVHKLKLKHLVVPESKETGKSGGVPNKYRHPNG
jgi:hypothetical protein